MKTNTKPAVKPWQRLGRLVSACLLWEDGFSADGQSIADEITTTAHECSVLQVCLWAREARSELHLRHVPLHLIVAALTHPRRKPDDAATIENTIYSVVQRADELSELVAMWWKDGRRPLPACMKRGLREAFTKFNAYSLAKYNRDAAVKLRDVLFLVHPKPVGIEMEEAWRDLAAGTLEAPDTWEVALSRGDDKKATFERLIREGSLGYLALLRNLRGMVEAGVDELLIRQAVLARVGASKVLPFRYVAAARACPRLEPAIDLALRESIDQMTPLPGKTIVLVDVSGSMEVPLSAKSDLTRMDAAAALASIVPAESLRVFSFSNRLFECPPRRGMSGVDAVVGSQPHGGTALFDAIAEINRIEHDRLIVITDEQDTGGYGRQCPAPTAKHAYIVNVASEKRGIWRGDWTRVEGFSEGVLRYIETCEKELR
jgi:60 kDa SS-A/Ro ribonucleoprotein